MALFNSYKEGFAAGFQAKSGNHLRSRAYWQAVLLPWYDARSFLLGFQDGFKTKMIDQFTQPKGGRHVSQISD